MLSKKSIVLNGVEETSKRAVLTLECDGEMTKGIVRLYNFSLVPRGIISLGICYNGQVVKAGLTHLSGMLFSFNCQISKIPENFSCAVVNFLDGEPKPILYGNSDGYSNNEDLFNEVIASLSRSENVIEVESVLDKHGIEFDEDLKNEINKEIEKCINEPCNDCENCQYKKFYLESIKGLNEQEEENISKEIETFYSEMKNEIDKLFENNPSEEYLEQLIPDSKWVKVTIEGSDDYYVLGLIYEDENLMYICYGVPGVYQKTSPRELSGYPVWFPLDETKPQGFGYWLSYQDANTGESVKAVIE